MNTEKTVRWLQDRAEISDLLFAFARALDDKDWQGYADLYADDGCLQLPKGQPVSKADLARSTQDNLGGYTATHHISANHQINVTGTTATSRSYLQAVHVSDPAGHSGHWITGGRYDNEYVRTPEGWRFSRVVITPMWQLNDPPAWATS